MQDTNRTKSGSDLRIAASDTVIACTLTAAELGDRRMAWLKLGTYLTASSPVPGGLALTFTPVSGLFESVGELVRLESECCAWMSFVIERLPAEVRLVITASGDDGERGVREAFAQLSH